MTKSSAEPCHSSNRTDKARSSPNGGAGGRADAPNSFDDLIAMRPAGGFSLIMADPPWSFENWSASGEAKNAKAHYGCMSVAEIAALPIAHIAARDSVLWLWATNPMLPQALVVMAAWGFGFKTAGHWVKSTKHGKRAFGSGYWLRCAGEPFLIGTRGKPKPGSRSIRSVIDGPVREHSRKPDEAFAAAEAMVPDGPRIEVFSREGRSGWASWGAEANKFGGKE